MKHKSLFPVSYHFSPSRRSIELTSVMNLKSAVLCLTLGLALSTAGGLAAQSQPSSSLVAQDARAAVRSQESLLKAQSLMQQALKKRSQHDLAGAYQDALEALKIAPSGPALGTARTSLVSDYCRIALERSRELIAGGRYMDAQTVAKSVLERSVDPGNKEAIQLLSDLEQPEIFNKTVTPKSAAQRDQVIQLLREAEGYTQSGRYDLAMRQYDAVLRIDPYNNASRMGMEAIHNSTIKYDDEAYNETRSRLLWQTVKSWERPARKSKDGRSTESVGRQLDLRGTDQIVAKLNTIIIPKIDLNDTPISEAVEYLKQKSVEQDPSKKGVNIFLKLGLIGQSAQVAAVGTTNTAVSSAPTTEPHIFLTLSNIPLYVALDYLSKQANLKLKIDPYAVSIVPLSEPTDVLVTKEYQVPPSFIPAKTLDAGTGLPQAGIPEGTTNASRVAAKQNAQDYLVSQGVEFPTGASANYLAAGSKLVVRNTRDNIDQIDALVDAATGQTPTQVDITTKFIEINQNNLQELGFDWLLGPFQIGGSGVYGSGGGNAAGVKSANYPFGNPYPNSAAMSPVGALRSGSSAIAGNSVDAAIAGQLGVSTAPAPGIFSIAGVFTDTQFQMVIHALNQKKGIDLMSAPKVTTQSGKLATVKVIEEFIYPSAYSPPQLPTSTTNKGVSEFPPTVTPSFPTTFIKQDLGVILEATPKIASDGYTIDLDLHPIVTDFDGFINYGSPINAIGYRVDPATLVETPILEVLTTNAINQPVFSVREVKTAVTVFDGSTVALGGLIREDVQKVQDKVPILGDIPYAGRLFRSDVDQKLKKNLIIFVTPRILTPDGQPRRDDVEEPETVKPLGLPQDLPLPTITSSVLKTK